MKQLFTFFQDCLSRTSSLIVCRLTSGEMRAVQSISNAADFVRQLAKLNSKQYRSCTTERNEPGGS
jgi:hypothetical protein